MGAHAGDTLAARSPLTLAGLLGGEVNPWNDPRS
jgi:hypothetical protein